MTSTKIKEMSYKVEHNIFIGRVPKDTHNWFKTFADEQFCSDFGMALKHLTDFYTGLIPSGLEHLEGAIEVLDERLTVVENSKSESKEEKKSIKFGNGKVISRS